MSAWPLSSCFNGIQNHKLKIKKLQRQYKVQLLFTGGYFDEDGGHLLCNPDVLHHHVVLYYFFGGK